MICPYNRKTQRNVFQWEQTFDEATGNAKSCQQSTIDTFEMMECPREGCAVWYDGRCHYAAVNLENE